jgi:hypothetical protein
MKTMVLALAVLAASVARAQEPPKQDPPKAEEKKQEEKKKATGPLGLPAAADLKEKCGLDDEQVKKVDALYAEYKDKAAEAQKKAKEAQDRKAAGQEIRTLRGEIAGKLKEIGKDDEQKKKIEECSAPQRRKQADK